MGLFSTLATIGGGAAGFAVGGPAGAVIGAGAGSAVTGGLKQPKSQPFAVQSPTQAAFGSEFEDIFLPETDEFGQSLGPGLLEQAFDPTRRDQPFRKAKKRTKKTFELERESATRSFIEDILPSIRESAGARGTGVSTGTQVAGVRAGEALFEDIGTRESGQLARLDLIRAQSQDALFNQIINASLQQSGTAGVGTPVFGQSPVSQIGQFAGGAAALKQAF